MEKQKQAKKTWAKPEIIFIASGNVHSGVHTGLHERNYDHSENPLAGLYSLFTPSGGRVQKIHRLSHFYS